MTHHGSRAVACAIVAALSIPVGGRQREDVWHVDLPAPAPAPAQSIREQELDTDVPVEPPRRRSPPPRDPPPRPRNTNRKVRTPDDEDLPAWVPKSGRLTVVESCDLAENLGLVPLGTAKSGECPSVALLLEQERIARAASAIEQHD
jgi:hypothetical protein